MLNVFDTTIAPVTSNVDNFMLFEPVKATELSNDADAEAVIAPETTAQAPKRVFVVLPLTVPSMYLAAVVVAAVNGGAYSKSPFFTRLAFTEALRDLNGESLVQDALAPSVALFPKPDRSFDVLLAPLSVFRSKTKAA